MMQIRRVFLAAAAICAVCAPALAVEGPSAAGPIGGTDIRSAQLPPPGVYGGLILVGADAYSFVDGTGRTPPELATARLRTKLNGPFLLYVPNIKVLGGSIGLAGVIPSGEKCGHLFANDSDSCKLAFGDPYVELDWSRSFGKVRPSKFPGALPILEGLTILAGFGVLLPLGQYDAADLTTQAISGGGNIWDFAPTVAATYTTRPILVEGTEFSAKLFWNNYRKNPDTDYSSGSVINVDFAITERIGRFQVGLAGIYANQISDDKVSGVKVPPDGRRTEFLDLGGIVNYDMPEHSAAVWVKGLSTVLATNSVRVNTLVLGWASKF